MNWQDKMCLIQIYEKVESAYIDSITQFEFVDSYDEINYKMLGEEYGYEKPKLAGMPDFK